MNKAIAVSAALIASLALAVWFSSDKPEFTIINTSSKASPATVFSMGFKKNIDAKWYQAANCEDGIKKFNNTENAIMSYNSSIEFAARNKGLNCPIAGVHPDNVIFVGETPVHLCRANGSTIDFGDVKQHTLGMASMYATKEHENRMNEAGANVEIIPFSGSKTVLTALKAGDIDLGWIGSGLAKKHSDKIDCMYSTDKNSANYLGNRIPGLKVPDFKITFVLYTNGDKPKVDQDAWDKFLTSRNIFTNDMNIDTVNEYVDTMFNNWSSKSNN
jgi:hypothetical protein